MENIVFFLGSEILTAVVMKSSVFWDITDVSEDISNPSSGSKNKSRNQHQARLATRRYIPEDRTLHRYSSSSKKYLLII
jgi:hypothetical protein